MTGAQTWAGRGAAVTAGAAVIAAGLALLAADPAGAQEIVSHQDPSLGGAIADAESENVSLSRDGRVSVFQSDARNLHPSDAAAEGEYAEIDVFAHDARTHATQLMSSPGSPAGAHPVGAEAFDASLSGDGNWVTFLSGPGPLEATSVFVRSLRTGIVQHVDHGAPPLGRGRDTSRPALSRDGRLVAYGIEADDGRPENIRVFDRRTGRRRVVFRARRSQLLAGVSIAAGGRVVAWTSFQVTAASANRIRIHRYDLRTRRHRIVARGWAPSGLANTGAYGTALSRDGRHLAYVDRPGSNAFGDNSAPVVRVYDARRNRTRTVSRHQGRVIVALGPVMCDSGRLVGFTVPAQSPVVAVHDQKRGRTRLLAEGAGLALSGDCRHFGYTTPWGRPEPRQVVVARL